MSYVLRTIQQKIEKTLQRGKSILLLGPRQTGKTTLLHKLPLDCYISLANLETRIGYEQDSPPFHYLHSAASLSPRGAKTL